MKDQRSRDPQPVILSQHHHLLATRCHITARLVQAWRGASPQTPRKPEARGSSASPQLAGRLREALASM